MRRSGVAVAGIVLVAAVAGCTTSHPGRGVESKVPSLTVPSRTVQEQALAAYRGMWRAYEKAGLTADPDEPELRRFVDGRALALIRDGLAGYRSKGQVLKGNLVFNPQLADPSPAVASTSGPAAVAVVDCLDDSAFLVYKASGGLFDDVPGGRRSTRATVTDLPGLGWRVTGLGIQDVGTC